MTTPPPQGPDWARAEAEVVMHTAGVVSAGTARFARLCDELARALDTARESGRREMRDAVLAAIKDAVDNGQHQMAHRLAAKDHDGALYLRGLDAGLVSLHYAVRSLTPADVATPARKP